MKILVIDCEFVGVDFALRCQYCGHEVRYFQAPDKGNQQRRNDGDGILSKVHDLDELRKKWIGWADLIFLCDNVKYLDMLEPFAKIGYPIFGPNLASAELETNRAVGQKAMAECGLLTIDSKTFNDYDTAIAYVKKHSREVFVSKPSGDADKALSYVSHNAADLVYMLERWKKNPKYVKSARECGFILQEKKIGCEMAVGGWFGPGGWSKWIWENWEYKKLMNGDLGVNTGEQGTLGRYVRQSKLADKILFPMTPVLERLGYVGYIDNNCIIDEKGNCWPMEFTCRPGWPNFHNQIAAHKGDPAKWMLDLIDGHDTLDAIEDVTISVVMSIPDYPYSHFTDKETDGIPIYGASDMERVHLQQVMLKEAPVMVKDQVVTMLCYVTSGDYVLVVTGTGETITGARRSAYSAIKKIKIPNSPSYRTDIGAGRMVKQLPEIQKLGYAKGLSF